MSNLIKLAAVFGVVAAISACAPKPVEEEIVVVQPEPISVEPTYTGKYK